jgi:hypothetical protein
MDDVAPAQCKHKHSRLRTPAALFLPHLVPKTSPIQPHLKQENIFTFSRHYLEHGLLHMSFDLTSIAQDVFFMPQCALNLFATSGHPKLREARFPCCLEWRFEQYFTLPHLSYWTPIRLLGVQVESKWSPIGLSLLYWTLL